MGFMKGRAAVRRTIDYLRKGNIVLNDSVKALAVQYNEGKEFQHHKGLYDFVFWHLPQIRYKNPEVHVITLNKLTPTPWIKAFLDDESEIVIDCDSRSREEIHQHIKRILGKSDELVNMESAQEFTIGDNTANFGFKCQRQCICEVPGQIPCTRWQPVPEEMRGKYQFKKAMEEREG